MDKETKLRGYTAIFFTIVSVILTAMIFKFVTGNGDSFDQAAISSLMLGFTLGGFVPGITHLSSIYPKLKNLLYIPFVGWAAFLVLIIGIPEFTGWIFMFVDLFRFIHAARKER